MLAFVVHIARVAESRDRKAGLWGCTLVLQLVVLLLSVCYLGISAFVHIFGFSMPHDLNEQPRVMIMKY